MSAYILRRVIQSFLVLSILSFVCFYTMSLMPGDPVDIMITSNPKITAADIQRLKKLYGLDQPVTYRYWNWLKLSISGDLGYSRTYRIPVADLLGPRLVNTFFLSAIALLVAIMVGMTIGIIAALKPGSKFDYIANFVSYALISMPSFWLAIVLIIVFAVWLPLLPAGGTQTVGDGVLTGFSLVLDRAKYLILPVISLSSLQIGMFVRYTRSSMIEALRFDFIRTARAKGLSQFQTVINHAFRNALLPLITVVALSMSSLFSGAIITETVFSYQGVGKLLYDAIIGNDFNVAMVSFMISVGMVLLMNLVADILYGIADPRISYL